MPAVVRPQHVKAIPISSSVDSLNTYMYVDVLESVSKVGSDGGGGNRTPVRKCLSGNVYMRSLFFGLVPENSSRQDLTGTSLS